MKDSYWAEWMRKCAAEWNDAELAFQLQSLNPRVQKLAQAEKTLRSKLTSAELARRAARAETARHLS